MTPYARESALVRRLPPAALAAYLALICRLADGPLRPAEAALAATILARLEHMGG